MLDTAQMMKRIGPDTLSPRTYNFIIGMTLLWGFAVNYALVKTLDPIALAGISPWLIMIPYFVSCFVGIWLFSSSDKPIISFLGYSLVVLPFGVMLNLIVSRYDPDIVQNAVLLTGAITLLMMVLASLNPAFFASIGPALFWSLLCAIIVELVAVFLFKVNIPVLDYIFALIFSGYIGYDWGRANAMPKTLDNAIDGAAVIYMDIINLFIRILRILGNRK